MTEPHDDASAAPAAGSLDPDTVDQPSLDLTADQGYAGANQPEDEDQPGTPDGAAEPPD